jgi:hypothetical protein
LVCRQTRHQEKYSYNVVVLSQSDPLLPGAIGFDRIAAVVVACPGRSIGLVKNSSKTLTANNDVAGRVGFAAPVRMAA